MRLKKQILKSLTFQIKAVDKYIHFVHFSKL